MTFIINKGQCSEIIRTSRRLEHGLLDGIPLGGLSPLPGPNGVHGEDGGADKDGGHDDDIDVEDAIKIVAHGREHGLQIVSVLTIIFILIP